MLTKGGPSVVRINDGPRGVMAQPVISNWNKMVKINQYMMLI